MTTDAPSSVSFAARDRGRVLAAVLFFVAGARALATPVDPPVPEVEERAVFAAPGVTTPNYFGRAMAYDDGDLFVGAPGTADPSYPLPGAVHVLRRPAGAWSFVQTLTSGSSEPDDFGGAVAADGDTLLVGAPTLDAKGHDEAGAVLAFTRSGGTWSLAQTLVPAAAAPGLHFGRVLALEGDVAVVGGPYESVGAFQSGVVRVFRRAAGVWTEGQTLLPPAAGVTQWFGSAVHLSGSRLFVGAPGDSNVANLGGAVHVYDDAGGTFAWTATFRAAQPTQFLHLGTDVVAAGSQVLAGSEGNAVFAFEELLGSWVEVQRLSAPDVEPGDGFGTSLFAEDDLLIVGSPQDSGSVAVSGSATVFERVAGAWHPLSKLVASDAAQFVGFEVLLAENDAFAGTLLSVEPDRVYVFDTRLLPYGAGCGPGGTSPLLEGGGEAAPGGHVTLTVEQALPAGASNAALLVVGHDLADLAFAPGCSLLVNPPLSVAPFVLDASGRATLSIPVRPTVLPTERVVQAFVADTSWPIGLAATRGLRVEIAP